MSKPDQDLPAVEPQAPKKSLTKVGFHNQANIKAAGRGIILEALTAFKGGKVGKRALLIRAMDELGKAFDSEEPATRAWAVENTLKLATAMTKDDKAGNPLEEMLKGAAHVQINFNSHFSQRSGYDPAIPAGQGVTIGFTPPPGPGDRPPSSEAGDG